MGAARGAALLLLCPCRVVLSVNDKWHYCQNSDILVGSRAMRDRHLRLLGYCLVQVSACVAPDPLLGQNPLLLVARGRAKLGGGWWELVSLPRSCPDTAFGGRAALGGGSEPSASTPVSACTLGVL